MKHHVLVTGGAGFIGSVLVPKLLAEGHEVTVFDNLMFGPPESLFACFKNKRFHFVVGDVRDSAALKFAAGPATCVVHLAAWVGYPICKKDPVEAVRVNFAGTANALASVGSDVPFIFTSTGSSYGNIEEICREDSPLNPLTVYGKTKAHAEDLVNVRGGVIFRYATGAGVSPRMRLDLLINDFCYRALKERNLVIYERKFKRSFINVDDMARSIIWAIDNYDLLKGETYNIGNPKMNLSKEEVAEALRKRIDFYCHYADFQKDEDQRNYEVSYDKAAKAGFICLTLFDETVEELLSLFQAFEVRRPFCNV